ncbi:MAG TPA: ABC transporter ATP-binding protein [Gemmatimonadaceae bacterium]|nr:ABC transporter ATP-binding protein [Gemmatimonadaceae bacterium]
MTLAVVSASRFFGRTKGVQALAGVDLTLDSGEILGLVGRNGAGKSTLLLAVAGMLRLDTGSVKWNGAVVPLGGSPGIAYAPERPAGEPSATVAESLWSLSVLRGIPRRAAKQAVAAALEVASLGDVADRRVSTLSRGNGQRLGFAQALLGEPSLLLLDETLSGMDPVVHRQVCRTIGALPQRGVSVILSSHDFSAVEELATRVAVMVNGRIAAVLEGRELRQPGSLRERFFDVVAPENDADAGLEFVCQSRSPGRC